MFHDQTDLCPDCARPWGYCECGSAVEVKRQLEVAKARLADIAHGARVFAEGRSCFSLDYFPREVLRVASAPL